MVNVIQTNNAVAFFLSTAAWGMTSLLWAELVRDTYHVLCHAWPPLYRLHVWHHKAFHRDFTVVSDQLYRKSQWCHDFLEALVMLLFSLLFWEVAYNCAADWQHLGGLVGCVDSLRGLLLSGLRGFGFARETYPLHQPGPFLARPSSLIVNTPAHWRHHFDNPNAYFCGVFTFLDKILGTALSLKGKTVVVTGTSDSLRRALLFELHSKGAKVIALTSSEQTVTLNVNGESLPVKTINWQVGKELELAAELEKVDILIINRSIDVHGERTLLELFLTTVRTNEDIATKEVWLNALEAEVSRAFSPIHELTKQAFADLVTLHQADAPCVLRKIILGPFKSPLNPKGEMSADWVAKQIINLAQRDVRNIIISFNFWVYLAHSLKFFFVYVLRAN